MVKKYRLYQIDSFTKEKFTGNPAGVITNADGLSEEQMQKIARELNNSETAFVFSSNSDAYDVHVRFFTPKNEVPICGHATVAAHYALAHEEKYETRKVIQKTGAGVLPVEIIKENEDYKIKMTQGKIIFGQEIDGVNKSTLLNALKLNNEQLLEDCPIQIVSTGHSKVMIGIKDKNVLNNMFPNFDMLSNLSKIIGCNGYYIFTFDSSEDDVLINGRMFAPGIGINEDPVTGNANGPLGAYLVHHKIVVPSQNTYKFKAKQGEAIGRTGIIEVEVKIDNSEPIEVKISGNAVMVFQSELSINTEF